MARLHFALHDLLLKYRLWGFSQFKNRLYSSLNYFDSEGVFFFIIFFPANTATFTSPLHCIFHRQSARNMPKGVYQPPSMFTLSTASRVCVCGYEKAAMVQKQASGSLSLSLSLWVYCSTKIHVKGIGWMLSDKVWNYYFHTPSFLIEFWHYVWKPVCGRV